MAKLKCSETYVDAARRHCRCSPWLRHRERDELPLARMIVATISGGPE